MKTKLALIIELDHPDCPQSQEDECIENFANDDLPALEAFIEQYPRLKLVGIERKSSVTLNLLEQVAEAWLKDHQELKNFMSGFGPKQLCDCSICDKAREAMRLKP